MRLKEESTLMFLEFIGLVIVLSSIFFDIANNKIENRQLLVSNKALYAVNIAIKGVAARQESFINTFNRFYQLQQIVVEHPKDEVHETPELKKLVEEFHKGKLTNNEFLEREIDIYNELAVNDGIYYNTQLDQLQILSDDKMIFWENLKVGANNIRILAIIIGMIFYLKLYKSIRERTK